MGTQLKNATHYEFKIIDNSVCKLSNNYLSEPQNTEDRISPGKPDRCPNNLITYNGYICVTITIEYSTLTRQPAEISP